MKSAVNVDLLFFYLHTIINVYYKSDALTRKKLINKL